MASPETGRLCCLRCGKPVGDEPSSRQHPESAHGACSADGDAALATATSLFRPSGYDGWETDEQLKHVARLLGSAGESDGESDGDADDNGSAREPGRKRHRFDASHSSPGGRHASRRAARGASARSHFGTRLIEFLAGTFLLLGLMASACGGVLLAWAVVMRRDDLWSVGLPIAVAGLLTLVVATVLQLDRLSGDHRETAARLEGFDSSLHQLRRDAAMMKNLPPTGGDGLHWPWSSGASPQLSLAELRSRLDMLASRLEPIDDETTSGDS